MEDEFSLFKLQYNNQVIQVEKATIKEQVVFNIIFENKTAPLIIGRIINFQGQKVWTSFPEGRQKEAEEIGPLIVKFYLSLKK